jgi:hypothetical protein
VPLHCPLSKPCCPYGLWRVVSSLFGLGLGLGYIPSDGARVGLLIARLTSLKCIFFYIATLVFLCGGRDSTAYNRSTFKYDILPIFNCLFFCSFFFFLILNPLYFISKHHHWNQPFIGLFDEIISIIVVALHWIHHHMKQLKQSSFFKSLNVEFRKEVESTLQPAINCSLIT